MAAMLITSRGLLPQFPLEPIAALLVASAFFCAFCWCFVAGLPTHEARWCFVMYDNKSPDVWWLMRVHALLISVAFGLRSNLAIGIPVTCIDIFCVSDTSWLIF